MDDGVGENAQPLGYHWSYVLKCNWKYLAKNLENKVISALKVMHQTLNYTSAGKPNHAEVCLTSPNPATK